MQWYDQDEDSLEVKVIHAFGPPVLVVTVNQESKESSVNLSRKQAEELVKYLNDWIESLREPR